MTNSSPRDTQSIQGQSIQGQTIQDVLVFLVLVAIGVAGRWGQPDWCFTPTAAVAVFAGFYFRRGWAALLVPLAVLGLTDLALPAYSSRGVMLAVYVALTLPVVLGRVLQRPSGPVGTACKLAACGLVPATLFFFMTNWAVWQFQNHYEPTLAGLVACYTAALPFYRAMLAGDIFYLTLLICCYAIATGYSRRPVRQHAQARRSVS